MYCGQISTKTKKDCVINDELTKPIGRLKHTVKCVLYNVRQIWYKGYPADDYHFALFQTRRTSFFTVHSVTDDYVKGDCIIMVTTLIARFVRPTWGPSGADRTQVGPMLAPWTLLSGNHYKDSRFQTVKTNLKVYVVVQANHKSRVPKSANHFPESICVVTGTLFVSNNANMKYINRIFTLIF